MDELQREGWRCNQDYPPPPGATCGNCGWLRELSDWTSDDEDEYGVCVLDEPLTRVRRDFDAKAMPCCGDCWMRR